MIEKFLKKLRNNGKGYESNDKQSSSGITCLPATPPGDLCYIN